MEYPNIAFEREPAENERNIIQAFFDELKKKRIVDVNSAIPLIQKQTLEAKGTQGRKRVTFQI